MPNRPSDSDKANLPPPAEPSPRTPGRIARHVQTAQQIYAEPRSAIGMLRTFVVRLWVARGAGFYGLGYLAAFVVLEVRMFAGEIVESDGVVELVTHQALEYVLRIGFMSFVNSFLALLWPIYVARWLGGWGLLMLLGGYLAFEHLLRPQVEAHIPELKEARRQARQQAELKKLRKAAKKQQNRRQ